MSVNIRTGSQGASILGGEEKNTGVIVGGVAVADKIALGEIVYLFSSLDARNLGIDSAYDVANNVRLYYHIKEFYRIAGNGNRLALMLVDRDTVTLEDMVEDPNEEYTKKMLLEASDSGNPIYQIAIGLNPSTGYTPTIVDGLNDDVLAAVTKGAALTEWANERQMDFTLLVEGRDLTGLANTVHDFRAANANEQNHVALVIAQDYDYASTLDALGQKHAAIGTALGAIALRNVNESIGWVEFMNLQNSSLEAFLNAGISSHVPIKDLGAGDGSQLETFIDRGYILARSYPGLSGYYFASDYTCAPVILDEDGNVNVHSISQSRTINKVIRGLRTQLRPLINSVVLRDPTTGQLSEANISFMQDEGDKVFSRMQNENEIVSGATTVDPNLGITGELSLSFEYVKTSILSEINGTVNQKITL